MHIQRANYQTYIWKNAHVANPATSGPEGKGWILDDGFLEYNWCDGHIIPQELVEILLQEAPGDGNADLGSHDDESDVLYSLVDTMETDSEDESYSDEDEL